MLFREELTLLVLGIYIYTVIDDCTMTWNVGIIATATTACGELYVDYTVGVMGS